MSSNRQLATPDDMSHRLTERARLYLGSSLSGLIVAGTLLCALPATTHAFSWLSKLSKVADDVPGGGSAGKHIPGDGLPTSQLAAKLSALPEADRGFALAVDATPSGHWRFVNEAGEAYTAASADEVARAIPTLLPKTQAVIGGGKTVKVIVTDDTLFRLPDKLEELPTKAEKQVHVGASMYRLRKTPESATGWTAEVRPNVFLAADQKAEFREALFQLARPLPKLQVRVLSLLPGGPREIGSVPRIDPVKKSTLIDELDPAALESALSRIKHQTVLVTGQRSGDVLKVTSRTGVAADLNVKSLQRAAEANDVNLVLIDAATARQPGGRNWLWQKVEVAGLKDAMRRTSFADFLSALAAQSGDLNLRARKTASMRVVIDATTRGTNTIPLGETFANWLPELTGEAFIQSVEIATRSRQDQKELDRRIIPGIPSAPQFAVIGSFLVGLLFGLATARRWWQQVWPPEDRAEYGNWFGYRAAGFVRGLAFWLLFLPLVGIPAAVWGLCLALYAIITAPFRWFAGTRA